MNDKLELLDRYLSGEAHPKEQLLIEKWLDEQAIANPEWEGMNHAQRAQWMADTYALILSSVSEKEDKLGGRLVTARFGKWMQVAALLAGLLVTALAVFLWIHKSGVEPVVVHGQRKESSVLPGRDRALLVLSDGTRVELDSLGNGRVAMQGGTEVVFRNGALVYDNAHAGKVAEILYNTVHTPKGGQFRLMLPDGTQVWLNAASSIRYPVTFAGATREVDVTGEAYFEVAHNKEQPFVAYYPKGDMARAGSIEVLGTHFNMNVYQDEPLVRTTLLEGKVKFSAGGASAVLTPGQQAITSGAHEVTGDHTSINVVVADKEQAVAWKNGLFHFNNDRLEDIMRQVSRWYDVDVVFASDVKDKRFGGVMSRKENVGAVLKFLSMTEAVHFTVEGRTITVKK